MLFWVFEPTASGVIIAYDLSGNQVLLHTFDVSRLTDICMVRLVDAPP